MSMITANEFVNIFGKEEEKKLVRFARIADTEGRLIFDGETTATQKIYPRLESYDPVVNHRVMIFHGVILGRVIK